MPNAQMLVLDAVDAVRASTAHDNDDQTTTLQIQEWIDRAYTRTRRWLSTFMPEYYAAEYLPPALVGAIGGALLPKPDDYERLIRIERQYPAGYWYPLTMRTVLTQKVGMAIDVSGQYRITYSKCPVDGYQYIDVPEGCEDIVIEEAAALVRNRHDEDPSFHLGRVVQLKREAMADLRMRYGAHPRSCLQVNPLYGPQTTFYEQGNNFVIF